MATKQKFAGVSAVELSANSKIGTVSATYASQKTRPKSCPFMNSGCYAENGNVGFQTARLNREVSGVTALQLAKNEVSAIRTLTGQLPLRLHVVGDCTTDKSAQIVSGAAVVVAEHKDTKAYMVDGVKVIPCPQQTGRAANCEACKLCFHADRLRATNAVIGFQTHGNVKRANNALVQLSQ